MGVFSYLNVKPFCCKKISLIENYFWVKPACMIGDRPMFLNIKKVIKKFLLELAKENEQLYGKDKLDCCKLNRRDKE